MVWHEPFRMKFNGGPYDGYKISHAGLIFWPLPDFIVLEEAQGSYIKIRESTLPEQTEDVDNHVIRGAEYDWTLESST